MSASNFAAINMSSNVSSTFSNEVIDDLLIYTSSNQSILIGPSTTTNSNAALRIGLSNGSNLVNVTGNINLTGSLLQNGSPYIGSQWTTNTSNVYISGSNVAIGKTSATVALDVVGAAALTGNLGVGGDITINKNDGGINVSTGNISVASGNGSSVLMKTGTIVRALINNQGFYPDSDNSLPLGFSSTGGRWSTVYSINGNFSSNVTVGATLSAQNINFTGSLLQNGSPYIGSQWTTSGANVFITGSNIGIGTTTPGSTLEVNGSVLVASNITTSNMTATGNVTIGGNLTVSGTTTTINTQTVTIADNIIQLNSTLSNTAPPSTLLSGIEVSRGTQSNYQFLFQESNQLFKIGQIGSLQAVATRPDAPNGYAVGFWDPVNTQIAFNSNFTYSNNLLYASNASISNLNISQLQLTASNVTVASNLQVGGNLQLQNQVAFKGIQLSRPNGTFANVTVSDWLNGTTPGSLYIPVGSNIGIGKSNPTVALDVVGSITATSNITTSNINFTGSLLQNGSPYIGSQWTTNTSNVYISGSNVAIGKTSAIAPLDVVGNANFSGNIAASNIHAFRNRIINGDFSVNQRNFTTASAGSGGNNGIYTVDRWAVYRDQGANTGNYTIATATISDLDGFNTGLSITNVTGSSTPGWAGIVQIIEGYNIKSFQFGTSFGKSITLSFWIKSTQTGTFGVIFINQNQGGGGARPHYGATYTVNTANTWERKTITIPSTSTGTWNTTTGNGMTVLFSFILTSGNSVTAGSWVSANDAWTIAGQSSLANNANVILTGVQLEQGTIPTPYEFRPYGTELQLCQRYFEYVAAVASVYQYVQPNNASYSPPYNYKVTKRAVPVVTCGLGNLNGNINTYATNASGSTTTTTPVSDFSTVDFAHIRVPGQAVYVYNYFISANAELT